MKNLLLITGAGASFDVVEPKSMVYNIDLKYRPPLTKHLFSPTRCFIEGFEGDMVMSACISECLKEHPVASAVGLGFKMHMQKGKEEESLEAYLSDLKNHSKILTKNQFWSIPLYLSELFLRMSRQYIPSINNISISTNYKLLIDEINKSQYTQLIWLNLNYDLLADFAIEASVTKKLDNFANYMRLETPDGLKIKYTKPHGSVDWFKTVIDDNHVITRELISREPNRIPMHFEKMLSKAIFTQKEWHDLHDGIRPIPLNYPALTAPMGDYEFVCSEHKTEIEKELQNTPTVLCIGFSALDKDILELIKKIPKIEKLKIVNGTASDGKKSYINITKARERVETGREESVFNGGFSDFVKIGIRDWLRD